MRVTTERLQDQLEVKEAQGEAEARKLREQLELQKQNNVLFPSPPTANTHTHPHTHSPVRPFLLPCPTQLPLSTLQKERVQEEQARHAAASGRSKGGFESALKASFTLPEHELLLNIHPCADGMVRVACFWMTPVSDACPCGCGACRRFTCSRTSSAWISTLLLPGEG